MNGELSIGMTTLLYISVFIISILLFALSVKSWDKMLPGGIIQKRHGKLGVIFSLVAITILCVLAGMRGDGVGADTAGYGIISFRYAQGKAFLRYLGTRTEYAFYGLAFLAAKVTDNESIWLGLLEFLTIAPIFYIIYKERNNISPVFSLAVFIFKFYNYSLCVIRQSLTCSFVILAIYFFQKKKYLFFALWTAVAIGIHSTALIGIICNILICLLIQHTKGKGSKVLWGVSIGLITAIALLPRIASFVLSTNFFPSYFNKFLDFFSEGKISRYGLFESIYRIILSIPLVYILRKRLLQNEFVKYSIIASIVGCFMYILCDLTWGINTVYRLTQYFDYYFIFSISSIPQLIKIKSGTLQRGRLYLTTLVICLLIIYWLMVYIIMPDGLGFKTEHFSFR